MYKKIYDFCKIKNRGNCFKNGPEPTPRVNFITSLCDEMGLDYEIDKFQDERGSNKPKEIKYRIDDFFYVEDQIPEDKLEQAEFLHSEYQKKMDDLYSQRNNHLEMEEVEEEYTQKFQELVGKLEREEKLKWFVFK
jgi:hypothetical protein